MEKVMVCFTYVKQFMNLKQFFFGKHIVADRPFKFATKYTVCMLMLLMILTFQTGLNCRGNIEEKLNKNEYCLNVGTFLVTKALQTDVRLTVQYPGVAPYNKEKDEVQKQEYYKLINYIYGILIAIAALPFFLWKIETVRKIEVILKLPSTKDMVKYYCTCQGRSGDVSFVYVLTKVLAIIVPIVQWFTLCIFFGQHFQIYGVDIIRAYLYNTWPNPADVLFPKNAMCEMMQYAPSGHLQTKSFVCVLEANHSLRWTMCCMWFWMITMFFISITHLICITFFFCKAKNLKFGDWIILRFLRCNLNPYDFSQFMVLYSKTQNNDLIIIDENLNDAEREVGL